jgi:hypothetical protein
MKISPGWLKQNILKKSNAPQKILTFYSSFRGVHSNCHFQYAFDDNLSVTHVFIRQIFRAVELAPPFPLPLTGLCTLQGVG